MEEDGWCADNVAFGSGGALLQKVDRDTQRCAFKCCVAVIDGQKVKDASKEHNLVLGVC